MLELVLEVLVVLEDTTVVLEVTAAVLEATTEVLEVTVVAPVDTTELLVVTELHLVDLVAADLEAHLAEALTQLLATNIEFKLT